MIQPDGTGPRAHVSARLTRSGEPLAEFGMAPRTESRWQTARTDDGWISLGSADPASIRPSDIPVVPRGTTTPLLGRRRPALVAQPTWPARSPARAPPAHSG